MGVAKLEDMFKSLVETNLAQQTEAMEMKVRIEALEARQRTREAVDRTREAMDRTREVMDRTYEAEFRHVVTRLAEVRFD